MKLGPTVLLGLLENHYIMTRELGGLPSDYETRWHSGKGSYGVVYCVRHRSCFQDLFLSSPCRRTGDYRALKSIQINKLEDVSVAKEFCEVYGRFRGARALQR